MNNFKRLRLSTEADFQPRISQTLRGFGEFPIGSAFSGPAYGDRNMPFAAAWAAGMSAAAYIGVTGVGATIIASASVVATAAMYAGLAMTVVGAITGDKELMTIGGYVGLAGGIGSLAIGAVGMIGSAMGTATATVTGTGFNAASTAIPVTQAATTTAIAPVAATPAMTAINAAGNATGATVQAGTSASNALGAAGNFSTSAGGLSAGNAAMTSQIMPAFNTATASQGVGNIGAEVGSEVAAKVGANSGLYDFITSPAALQVGAGMLTGSLSQDEKNTANKLLREKQEYDRMATERGYANASSLPDNINSLSVGKLSPSELAASQTANLQNSIKRAKVITQAAGA